jgi:hypothetical protein
MSTRVAALETSVLHITNKLDKMCTTMEAKFTNLESKVLRTHEMIFARQQIQVSRNLPPLHHNDTLGLFSGVGSVASAGDGNFNYD